MRLMLAVLDFDLGDGWGRVIIFIMSVIPLIVRSSHETLRNTKNPNVTMDVFVFMSVMDVSIS